MIEKEYFISSEIRFVDKDNNTYRSVIQDYDDCKKLYDSEELLLAKILEELKYFKRVGKSEGHCDIDFVIIYGNYDIREQSVYTVRNNL